MTTTIPDFLANILEYRGSIIERMEDGALEAIVSKETSQIVNIPEHARFCFSYNAQRENSIYASYDSELFKSMISLLGDKGMFSRATFETIFPNVRKISKTIENKVFFNNAVFRMGEMETRKTSYLFIWFKYTALSDERHKGITSVLINQETLSTVNPENGLDAIWVEIKKSDKEMEISESPKIFQAAYAAAVGNIKIRLEDFVKSLERRLNREIQRVCEYYETLEEETMTAIKRKITCDGQDMNAIDRQIKDRTVKVEGMDKFFLKLDAIEIERKWKVNDLLAKYSLSLKIDPVSAISIVTDVPVFWISLKRRLSSRDFPVMYNTLIRQLDPLPCESCFNPWHGYFVCDEKTHIVCGNCFNACAHCGKAYCRACHEKMCPKCKAKPNLINRKH